MKAIKNYMSCLAIIILALISEPIRFFLLFGKLGYFRDDRDRRMERV